jgi:hypothetical protein
MLRDWEIQLESLPVRSTSQNGWSASIATRRATVIGNAQIRKKEKTRQKRRSLTGPTKKCYWCTDRCNRIAVGAGEHFSAWPAKAVKKKKKRNPKHIKCLNCETRGHKIQNCPKPRKKVFFSYEWKISISFTFKYKSRLGWEFNISTPSSVWKPLAPCLIVCWNYTRVYQNYVTRKIRSPVIEFSLKLKVMLF